MERDNPSSVIRHPSSGLVWHVISGGMISQGRSDGRSSSRFRRGAGMIAVEGSGAVEAGVRRQWQGTERRRQTKWSSKEPFYGRGVVPRGGRSRDTRVHRPNGCTVTTPMLPAACVRGGMILLPCDARTWPADSAFSTARPCKGFCTFAARTRPARLKAPNTSPPKLSVSSAMPRNEGSAG